MEVIEFKDLNLKIKLTYFINIIEELLLVRLLF